MNEKEEIIINRSVPIWNFPSALIVAWEYAQIFGTKYPNCTLGDIEVIAREALPASEENWPYPIQGDKIICQCGKYGKSFTWIFNFRKPLDTESPKNILEEIVDIWLNICSSSMVPDYVTFLSRMNNLRQALQMDDKVNKTNIYKDFLNLIAERLSRIESKIKEGVPDVTYFNKFKLLLKLCGDIPR